MVWHGVASGIMRAASEPCAPGGRHSERKNATHALAWKEHEADTSTAAERTARPTASAFLSKVQAACCAAALPPAPPQAAAINISIGCWRLRAWRAAPTAATGRGGGSTSQPSPRCPPAAAAGAPRARRQLLAVSHNSPVAPIRSPEFLPLGDGDAILLPRARPDMGPTYMLSKEEAVEVQMQVTARAWLWLWRLPPQPR